MDGFEKLIVYQETLCNEGSDIDDNANGNGGSRMITMRRIITQ